MLVLQLALIANSNTEVTRADERFRELLKSDLLKVLPRPESDKKHAKQFIALLSSCSDNEFRQLRTAISGIAPDEKQAQILERLPDTAQELRMFRTLLASKIEAGSRTNFSRTLSKRGESSRSAGPVTDLSTEILDASTKMLTRLKDLQKLREDDTLNLLPTTEKETAPLRNLLAALSDVGKGRLNGAVRVFDGLSALPLGKLAYSDRLNDLRKYVRETIARGQKNELAHFSCAESSNAQDFADCKANAIYQKISAHYPTVRASFLAAETEGDPVKTEKLNVPKNSGRHRISYR